MMQLDQPSGLKGNQYLPEFCLGLITLILLLAPIQFPDLSTRGEAREALVAWDMFNNSHWLLPRGYGGEVASKPPLLHWTVALVSLVIGFGEFSLRTPLASFATLFLVINFACLRRLFSFKLALLSTIAILFSMEWLRAATTCRVDMAHAAPLAASWIGYFLLTEGLIASGWWILSVLIALSFLAKGPVAVILSFLVVSIYEFASKNHRGINPKRLLLLFLYLIAIPTLIASTWYLLAYCVGGAEFVEKFVEENLSRFTGQMKKPAHEHGIFYLFGASLVGFLPWSLLGLKLRSIKDVFKWFKVNPDLALTETQKRFFTFNKICWLSVFIFYLFPSSKRGVYLLAGYPFLINSVLIINFLDLDLFEERLRWLSRLMSRAVVVLYLVLFMALLISLMVGSPYGQGEWQKYPLLIKQLFLSYSLIGLTDSSALKFITLFISSLQLLLPLIISLLVLWNLTYKLIKEDIRKTYLFGLETGSINVIALLISLYLSVQGVFMPFVSSLDSGRNLSGQLRYHFVGTESKNSSQNSSLRNIRSFGQEFYSLSLYSQIPFKTAEGKFFDQDYVIMHEGDYDNFKSRLDFEQSFEILFKQKNSLNEHRTLLFGRVNQSIISRPKEDNSKDPERY